MKAVAVIAATVLLGIAVTLASPAASSRRQGAQCGVERWAVKTLSDPAAGSVNFHAKTTTVSRPTKFCEDFFG